MKIPRKPIIMVRRVGKLFEYFLQEGNKKLNFFLTPETHEDLKQAQRQAEEVPQRREGARGVIELQEVLPDQKSLAAER